MADADLYGLLTDDEPTAVEKTRALAQAMAAQRANAQASRDFAGMYATLGSAGGKAQSQNLMGTADAQETQSATLGQQLLAALGQRQKRAQEADELKRQRSRDAETVRHDKAMEGASNVTLFNGDDGVVRALDHKTGQIHVVGQAPPKGSRGGSGGKNDLDTALGKLKDDLDPTGARKGTFGKDAGLITAADKVLALIKNPETGVANYNLTVRQIPELVQSVAGMLSSGSVAAQAQLEHLMPNTAGMSLAQKLEYLTSSPKVANVQDFVKQYAETAEREKSLAQKRIRGVQLQHLTAHQSLFSSHPTESTAVARQYLKDLEDEQILQAAKGALKDSPAAAEPASALTTKTIGGKTYVKKPDGWHEVTNG